MSDRNRPTTADPRATALMRTLLGKRGGTTEKTNLIGSSLPGNTGNTADNQGWGTNPMTTPGDLVIGGESGAPARLAAGTENYVLKIVDGVPTWVAVSGSGGGSGFQYRHLVLTSDGAGGWGFVTATIDGQTYPVTSLADLE